MFTEMDFQYCPRCGNNLIRKGGFLLVCRNCLHEMFINPRPTVGVILVNEKNDLLLVKRRFPPKKGYWDMPGGFVEPNESIEDSLRREIKEELGIRLDKISYHGSYPGTYIYGAVSYPIIAHDFISKVKNPILKVQDDISAVTFFKKNEIPFERIAFSNIKKSIKTYLSSLKKSPPTKNPK